MIKQQVVKHDFISDFFMEFANQGINCQILTIQPHTFVAAELEQYLVAGDEGKRVEGLKQSFIVDTYLVVYIPQQVQKVDKPISRIMVPK